MLYHFLLIFPLGLKEFLTTYLSSISPCFYPTGLFGGLILFIDLKMDSIKGRVLQLQRGCSHLGMFPTWELPMLLSSSILRTVGSMEQLPASTSPWCLYNMYIYVHQKLMKTLWFTCHYCIPFTFQVSHFSLNMELFFRSLSAYIGLYISLSCRCVPCMPDSVFLCEPVHEGSSHFGFIVGLAHNTFNKSINSMVRNIMWCMICTIREFN
jgi:hypothetical protein